MTIATEPVVTRTPRRKDFTDLGGPDEPGDEYLIWVDDIPVGGTYWCGSDQISDGERWGSWGPGGLSLCHYSRELAERVQVEAYVAMRQRLGSTPAVYRVCVELVGGGAYLVELRAWTWEHARQSAVARWSDARGVQVLDDDDDTTALEPIEPDDLTVLIERRLAEEERAAAERGAGDPWVRADAKRRRLEARAGIRYTAEGLRYGTPRTSEDDPRFSKESAPADAFGPHAGAVWAVLDRVSWWTWEDARLLLGVARRHLPVRSMWDWERDRDLMWNAGRAAGGHRAADMECLSGILRQIKVMITPVQAGRKSGQYSRETADWDDVFAIALDAASAFMVAQRPEFPPVAYEALTRVWRVAFPGDPVPSRSMSVGVSVGAGEV